MNNKLMYNRCVIPELGVIQEWRTGEEKESRETKRKQKALLREVKKQEKIKMLQKTREQGKKKKKKKQHMKNIRFERCPEDETGRKKYKKVITENYKRRQNAEDFKTEMKESYLIYESFVKTFLGHEESTKRGRKRKKKRVVKSDRNQSVPKACLLYTSPSPRD